MTTLESIILGIIQGLTEFLPVSSSGHLAIAQAALGLGNMEQLLFFDILLHIATLLSIFCVFAKEIRVIFQRDRVMLLKICIAILPLFPLVLIMKPIKAAMNDPHLMGVGFLVTSALLFWGDRQRTRVPSSTVWKDPLIIGLFQAVSVLPSISRSGSTIAAARFLGWSRPDAVTFSFLLAIPTVLGAMLYEGASSYLKGNLASSIVLVSPMAYVAGFITAFVIGIGGLMFIRWIARHGTFRIFAWYTLAVGIVTIWYTNFS